MDYRSRKYYLVSIPYFSRDMRLSYFKIAAPTLKMSPPYNHIRKEDIKKYDYDGKHFRQTDVRRPDMMISCRIEDAEALEYELRKMVRNDNDFYGRPKFCELTKEICRQ